MKSPVTPPPLFEGLFAEATHPILVLDPVADRIRYANRSACLMLGYDLPALLATPLSDLHRAEPWELRTFFRRVERDGRAWTVALTWTARSGAVLPTEMMALPVFRDRRLWVVVLVADRSDHRGRRS